ncbi:helix-turn-helix transcriptional regulator [Streptomyces prunicolor]|uniref:helix-turn-helix domain-containing protein n=1 Tax=Streptomyces prunicolor TaxID=67348 RepID=UPI00225494C8|nr:helix-turn-helix transcriptional regulator [Streptomyces prunicolor]MCX5239049.1 helix-turn-helix transcriptional regulator [Streptomyces prunicolor]
MTGKLDYRWRLREVMATRGMFSTTDLRPLLAERGIDLSPSQTYRLVVERPERLSLKTLMALLDILGCAMEDLIEPLADRPARGEMAASGDNTASGSEPGVGSFRPKRARIVPPEE